MAAYSKWYLTFLSVTSALSKAFTSNLKNIFGYVAGKTEKDDEGTNRNTFSQKVQKMVAEEKNVSRGPDDSKEKGVSSSAQPSSVKLIGALWRSTSAPALNSNQDRLKTATCPHSSLNTASSNTVSNSKKESERASPDIVTYSH